MRSAGTVRPISALARWQPGSSASAWPAMRRRTPRAYCIADVNMCAGTTAAGDSGLHHRFAPRMTGAAGSGPA